MTFDPLLQRAVTITGRRAACRRDDRAIGQSALTAIRAKRARVLGLPQGAALRRRLACWRASGGIIFGKMIDGAMFVRRGVRAR